MDSPFDEAPYTHSLCLLVLASIAQVDEVVQATQRLLTGLVTAAPKDREIEAARRRARAAKRFAAA